MRLDELDVSLFKKKLYALKSLNPYFMFININIYFESATKNTKNLGRRFSEWPVIHQSYIRNEKCCPAPSLLQTWKQGSLVDCRPTRPPQPYFSSNTNSLCCASMAVLFIHANFTLRLGNFCCSRKILSRRGVTHLRQASFDRHHFHPIPFFLTKKFLF